MKYYDLERHKKLLKLSQDLEEQGKSLLQEDLDQYFELARYQIAIEHCILWQERDQIVLFLKNFLNKKIDAKTFCNYTSSLHRKIIEEPKKYTLELLSNSENMKHLQPDEDYSKLKGLLTVFFCECDNLEETEDINHFYTSMKSVYLKLERILNEG